MSMSSHHSILLLLCFVVPFLIDAASMLEGQHQEVAADQGPPSPILQEDYEGSSQSVSPHGRRLETTSLWYRDWSYYPEHIHKKIPYYYVLSAYASYIEGYRENLNFVSDIYSKQTCLSMYEVPKCSDGSASTSTERYNCMRQHQSFTVYIDDLSSTRCKAMGDGMRLHQCAHTPGAYWTPLHEWQHIVGMGHEQHRGDRDRWWKMIGSPDAETAGDMVRFTVKDKNNTKYWLGGYGNYDWLSVLHYPTITKYMDSGREGLHVKCRVLSPEDVRAVHWSTNYCAQEPILPRCRLNYPDTGLIMGTGHSFNLTFNANYRPRLHLLPTFTGLPPGAMVYDIQKDSLSEYWYNRSNKATIQIIIAENTSPGAYALTATFTSHNGNESVTCGASVTVVNAPFACNGIASNDPTVCNGHGVCNSALFPACQCHSGYGGEFCDGLSRCRGDVAVDFDPEDPEIYCNFLGNFTHDPYFVKAGWKKESTILHDTPDGPAYNFTGYKTIRLMDKPVRIPISMSFLIRIAPNATYSQIYSIGTLSSGYVFCSSSSCATLSKKGWVFVRGVVDLDLNEIHWIVDGELQKTSSISAYTTLEDITVNSFSFSAGGGYTWMGLDRIRVYCQSGQIEFAFPQSSVAVEKLTRGAGYFVLKASHPDYRWDISKVRSDALCNTSIVSVQTSLEYQVSSDTSKPHHLYVYIKANITSDTWIQCARDAKYFLPFVSSVSSVPVKISAEPLLALKLPSGCQPTQGSATLSASSATWSFYIQGARPNQLQFAFNMNVVENSYALFDIGGVWRATIREKTLSIWTNATGWVSGDLPTLSSRTNSVSYQLNVQFQWGTSSSSFLSSMTTSEWTSATHTASLANTPVLPSERIYAKVYAAFSPNGTASIESTCISCPSCPSSYSPILWHPTAPYAQRAATAPVYSEWVGGPNHVSTKVAEPFTGLSGNSNVSGSPSSSTSGGLTTVPTGSSVSPSSTSPSGNNNVGNQGTGTSNLKHDPNAKFSCASASCKGYLAAAGVVVVAMGVTLGLVLCKRKPSGAVNKPRAPTEE